MEPNDVNTEVVPNHEDDKITSKIKKNRRRPRRKRASKAKDKNANCLPPDSKEIEKDRESVIDANFNCHGNLADLSHQSIIPNIFEISTQPDLKTDKDNIKHPTETLNKPLPNTSEAQMTPIMGPVKPDHNQDVISKKNLNQSKSNVEISDKQKFPANVPFEEVTNLNSTGSETAQNNAKVKPQPSQRRQHVKHASKESTSISQTQDRQSLCNNDKSNLETIANAKINFISNRIETSEKNLNDKSNDKIRRQAASNTNESKSQLNISQGLKSDENSSATEEYKLPEFLQALQQFVDQKEDPRIESEIYVNKEKPIQNKQYKTGQGRKKVPSFEGTMNNSLSREEKSTTTIKDPCMDIHPGNKKTLVSKTNVTTYGPPKLNPFKTTQNSPKEPQNNI